MELLEPSPDFDELHQNLRAWLDTMEASHRLDITDAEHLPPQTRLVVTCGKETHIEFTILDNQTRKVLVKDERNFNEPKEGILLGTKPQTRARARLGIFSLDHGFCWKAS